MKVKAFILAGLTSFAAYTAYQKRDQIKSGLAEANSEKDLIQMDLDNIKVNLNRIQTEIQKIQSIGDDLTYKVRVFNQDTQPKINQIKERMDKYQK